MAKLGRFELSALSSGFERIVALKHYRTHIVLECVRDMCVLCPSIKNQANTTKPNKPKKPESIYNVA